MIRKLLSRFQTPPRAIPPRVEPKLKRRTSPVLRIRNMPQKDVVAMAERVFKPYAPPPSVRGPDALAMDAMPGMGDWIGQNYGIVSQFLEDGLYFKGYATLAAMMLRAEFRKPVEVIAKEATREWIKFKSNDALAGREEPEEIQEKIAALEAEFKRLNVRAIIRRQITHGLAYGLGHVWVDTGAALVSESQKVPLTISKNGIKKGSVKRLLNVDPIWTNPNNYNADNPLRPDYFRPTTWWVQGVEVHASRMFTTVPFEVPDILKPAFNFGGLSLTQQLEAYVHNFLRTRQDTSDLVHNFASKILKTNMAGNMQTDAGMDYGDINADDVTGRVQAMTAWQSNNGTIIIDKESEDYAVAAVPLSGLDALQAQSQEFMASIPGIPLVKLFGIQPTGLNASGDSEVRVFYDEIAAFQEANIAPSLDPIFHLAQLNLWGEIDESLTYEFVHLWQLSEKEAAEVEKIKADIDALNIQEGKITPDEAREREGADPHSVYCGINLAGDAPGLPDTGFNSTEEQPSPKSLMSGDE